MTKMDQIPATSDPWHLALIAQTKMGKSTYCADAAAVGWPMIYLDSDNGISALRHALRDRPEVMSRIFYFRTETPCVFLEKFVSERVFRWNLDADEWFEAYKARPADRVVEIIPSRIPQQIVLTIDSWTAVALDAMMIGAENKKTKLEEMVAQNAAQGVYQDAWNRLNILLAIMQKLPFHTITQMHPAVFEKVEKPLNMKAKDIKQGDVVIREICEIPLSCSKPHGYSMGKYFTDIGWIEIDRTERITLDFKRRFGRISGGRLDDKKSIEEYSWGRIVGKPIFPYDPETDSRWIKYFTAEEFAASQPAKIQSPSAGSGTVLPVKPVIQNLQQLMMRK